MSKLDDIIIPVVQNYAPFKDVIDENDLPVQRAKAAIKELIYGLMTEAVHGPSGELRYSDLEELVKAL